MMPLESLILLPPSRSVNQTVLSAPLECPHTCGSFEARIKRCQLDRSQCP